MFCLCIRIGEPKVDVFLQKILVFSAPPRHGAQKPWTYACASCTHLGFGCEKITVWRLVNCSLHFCRVMANVPVFLLVPDWIGFHLCPNFIFCTMSHFGSFMLLQKLNGLETPFQIQFSYKKTMWESHHASQGGWPSHKSIRGLWTEVWSAAIKQFWHRMRMSEGWFEQLRWFDFNGCDHPLNLRFTYPFTWMTLCSAPRLPGTARKSLKDHRRIIGTRKTHGPSGWGGRLWIFSN